MADHSQRRRPFRAAARNRNAAPRQDAVEVAVAAQIAVCIAALLLAFGFRQFSGERYGDFRLEYRDMLHDESRAISLAGVTGGVGSFFGELYGSVRDFITGEQPETHSPQMPPQMPGPDAEDEPAELELYLPPPGEAYDYLVGETAGDAGGGTNPPPAGFSSAPAFMPAFKGMKIRPPVTGLITSGFAYRTHPISGNWGFHNALDIAANAGTPIRAALSGEVAAVGYDATYGNYITLKHAMELSTYYAHCSEVLKARGDAVEQGEVIALVGDTGLATGPHLHFAVIIDGEFIDPEQVLKDYVRPLE